MTIAAGTELETQFRTFYSAFNARDVDGVLARMAHDVDWANGMTGGRVHGHDAVRAYWAGQWESLDPRVEPVRVMPQPDGTVALDVHQVVRDRAGTVLLDQMVRHVYRLQDGLIVRMTIEPAPD